MRTSAVLGPQSKLRAKIERWHKTIKSDALTKLPEPFAKASKRLARLMERFVAYYNGVRFAQRDRLH